MDPFVFFCPFLKRDMGAIIDKGEKTCYVGLSGDCHLQKDVLNPIRRCPPYDQNTAKK